MRVKIISLFIFILVLSACQPGPTPDPSPTAVAAPTATPTPTPDDSSLLMGLHSDSHSPAISLQGGFLAFVSRGGDLPHLGQYLPAANCPTMGGGTIPCDQVYWYERSSRTFRLVSISPDGQPGDGNSASPDLSADGRYVAFASSATNLSPDKPSPDWGVFVHDTQSGLTELISAQGSQPVISADGRFVAYNELQTNWEVVVYDRQTKNKVTASLGDPNSSRHPGDSLNPAISADGRWLAFWSWDGSLVPTDNVVCGPEDGRYNCGDVFLYDGTTAETKIVEVGLSYGLGIGPLPPLSLSGEGRLVAFENSLYDRVQGLEQPLCGREGPDCSRGLLSVNGAWVAYAGPQGVFLHQRSSGESRQINLSPDGQPGDGTPVDYQVKSEGESFVPGLDLSGDGRLVVFAANDANLDPRDSFQCSAGLFPQHNCYDIYLYDRDLGTLEWISR